MLKYKISIVVATYNAEKTIRRCIDSILEQAYEDKEIIVVDGASTDGTMAILSEYRSKLAWCSSSPDSGVYDAWNKGLEHITGDWVCFLGSDDFFWSNQVLVRMHEALSVARQAGVRIVYGQVAVVDATGMELEKLGFDWGKLRKAFRYEMCIPHPGLMHDSVLFQELGKFDTTFRIAGDYDFLLRELLHRDALYVPGLVTVGMTIGGLSSNQTNLRLLVEETERAKTKQDLRGFDLRLGWLNRAKLKLFLSGFVGEWWLGKIRNLYRYLAGKGLL